MWLSLLGSSLLSVPIVPTTTVHAQQGKNVQEIRCSVAGNGVPAWCCGKALGGVAAECRAGEDVIEGFVAFGVDPRLEYS